VIDPISEVCAKHYVPSSLTVNYFLSQYKRRIYFDKNKPQARKETVTTSNTQPLSKHLQVPWYYDIWFPIYRCLLIDQMTYPINSIKKKSSRRWQSSQQIPRTIWNPKVNDSITQTPPPPILSVRQTIITYYPTLCLGDPLFRFPSPELCKHSPLAPYVQHDQLTFHNAQGTDCWAFSDMRHATLSNQPVLSLDVDLSACTEVMWRRTNKSVLNTWTRLHNKELYALQSSLNITQGDQIKNTAMSKVCRTYGVEERCVQGLGGKTWGKQTTWKAQA
jgi:hypothetical protein